MIVLQLIIIALYLAMLACGVWVARLVRELIATIRRVDVTLAVTETMRRPITPDPVGALVRREGASTHTGPDDAAGECTSSPDVTGSPSPHDREVTR